MTSENKSDNDLKNEGYFLESDIAVEGYDINSVSKKKLSDEKFRSRCDFAPDWDNIVSLMDGKATVYSFKNTKRVKALYIVRKEEDRVVCDRLGMSTDVPEDMKEAIDKYMTFLTSKSAINEQKKIAIFDGFRVPALKSKTKFNWGLFLLWVMVFGGAMGISLKNPGFIGCGIPLAFCISYKTYYKYDDPDTVIQLDGSADTASKEDNEQ